MYLTAIANPFGVVIGGVVEGGDGFVCVDRQLHPKLQPQKDMQWQLNTLNW